MPREIKTTLMVDGEAAFKQSINAAQTSIRNMGTQLTLAAAQFRADGDAMKLMESRSKTLKAEVAQQENIVKALEQAVKESSQAYGENSEKTERWEAELNRARTRLVNLQSELTLNEQGLDRNGRAFDQGREAASRYGEELQNIGKNVSLETLSKGVEGVSGAIGSAIEKVIELGGRVTSLMREAAQWADDLATKALQYNMSEEDVQRMEYASNFADVPADTIMAARDRVIRKMVSGWKGEGGITNDDTLINDLKKRLIRKSRKKILMADHTKFGGSGFYKTCDFSEIDLLITDDGTPPETIGHIRTLCRVEVVAP